MKKQKAVLVYQAGLANVFKVTSFNLSDYGRDAHRLMQGDFRSCEYFAKGLSRAGWTVKVAACNQAGDIVGAHWTEEPGQEPFCENQLYHAGDTIKTG